MINFNKSGLFRILFVLSGGVILGNIISILIQPVISRLYTPEQFGEYTLFVTISSICVPILSFSLPHALFAFQSQRVHMEITALMLKSFWIIKLFLFICLFLFLIFDLSFNVINITSALIISLMTGMFTLLQMIDVKNQKFDSKAIYYFIFVSCLALSKVAFYFFIGKGDYALQAAHFFAIYAVVFLYLLKQKRMLSITFKVRKETLQSVKEFAYARTASTLLNTCSILMPSIFISIYFDRTILGLYGMAYAIGMAPMIMIGGAIYEYLLSKMNTEKNYFIRNKSKIIHFLIISVILSIVLSSFFYYNGGYIFGKIFGPEWVDVSVYFSSILTWSIIGIGIKPFLAIITTSNAERENLFIEIVMFILRVLILFAASTLPISAVTLVFVYALTIIMGDLLKVPLAIKYCK